jgi:hypothetical protein
MAETLVLKWVVRKGALKVVKKDHCWAVLTDVNSVETKVNCSADLTVDTMVVQTVGM